MAMGPRKLAEQLDLFFANIVDPCLRDQRDTMAIPFFSLEKRKRTKPLVYAKNGVEVTVSGLADVGIATIWDSDFLIWTASELNAAVERGETPSRRLWVTPYHFLVQTKRIEPSTKKGGGRAYRDFEALLDRLQGTSIKTNIKVDEETVTERFHWVEYWRAHTDEKGRVKGVEVVLSDWFFQRVVKDRAILSIHEDYFLLTGGIERWLYKIARKHCGSNETGWSFGARSLHEKYPPGREYRFFKRDLKAVVARDCLPEYHSTWETVGEGKQAVDWVHFHLREGTLMSRRLPRTIR